MLDRLTLDQMRTLVMVADEGSFSAAGRKLGRVQSGVSQTIQALEATLGLALFDRSAKSPALTEAGRALLPDARRLIAGVEALRARAESITDDVEPELAVAVEALFPNEILMRSLTLVTGTFPDLRVSLFTETLGGALQRLREGAVRLAFFPPLLATQEEGLEAQELLLSIPMVPVVAASHPLAAAKAPIARTTLEDQVQLILTDRTQITARFSGGVISRRVWRFADLNTRLEYLLAGFGWCHMPLHAVADHIAAGRLKRLELAEPTTPTIPIHIVYPRMRPPGRAGRLLIADLRKQIAGWSAGLGTKAPNRAKTPRKAPRRR